MPLVPGTYHTMLAAWLVIPALLARFASWALCSGEITVWSLWLTEANWSGFRLKHFWMIFHETTCQGHLCLDKAMATLESLHWHIASSTKSPNSFLLTSVPACLGMQLSQCSIGRERKQLPEQCPQTLEGRQRTFVWFSHKRKHRPSGSLWTLLLHFPLPVLGHLAWNWAGPVHAAAISMSAYVHQR